MLNVDDYILGNEMLHKRLCVATEMLLRMVLSTSRSVSIAQLANDTGHPVKELARECRSLWHGDLLKPDTLFRSEWVLCCEFSTITLEDVLRCVIGEQAHGNKRSDAPFAL